MRWNSQKVNQILEQYKSDSSLKPIVRDITIDHILSDSSEELQFPFLISPTEGIPIFRTPHLSFEYTDEEIQSMFEIKSDATSILKYFNLKEFDYQKDWINHYQNKRYNFFIKSRQIGVTTLSLICAIHYILTNTEKVVVFLCRDVQDATDKFDKFIKLYNDNIPFYLKSGVTKISGRNKSHSMDFESGCRIVFKIQSELLIGASIDFLIIEDLELMKIDILPTNSPLVRDRILVSTLPSNDTKSWVYKVCNNQTLHQFNLQYFDWSLIKDRDFNWIRHEMIHLGGLNEFINQYCCGRVTPETQSYLRDIKIDSIL
jgi:hypothetical protein